MMKERWLEVESEASAKPERQFERWLSAEGVTFSGPEAEEAYRERVTLLKEAIELEKAPQRIPVCPSPGFFPMEYAGISVYDAMYDYDKLAQSWVKYCDDFGPDSFTGPTSIVPGRVFDLLDFKLYKWPGHGVPKDRVYQ